jgi:predicted transcriptional regulator of viral defense system
MQGEKTFFTIHDAVKIMNKPRNYVSKILSSSNRVRRIERGKFYIRSNKGLDIFEIASQIVFPSYVSLFAAMQFHALTNQIVDRYSIISIKRHREVQLDGVSIEFRTIARDKFFGYTKVRNSYVATIEKTILDSIYFGTPPLSYVEDAFSAAVRGKKIDKRLFENYAIRMRSRSLLKVCSKLFTSNELPDRVFQRELL